ncbi:MAG: hypothetical protein OXM55_03580 [Bdellovibrionales bacterium]|nr:hypothetical protein [Bdellovibrionales bacterium]
MKSNVCIKIASVFIMLFSFIFSLSAFAFINCSSASGDYEGNLKVFKTFPNDLTVIHTLGINAYCTGREEEGIKYIERASDGGHIKASNVMALYYETDNGSVTLTKDPVHFDKMLFYYERAATQIELASNYPEGTTEDMPYLEEHNRTSAKIFVSLPYQYYKGYGRALGATLRGDIEYVDTEEVVYKMRESSERCLRRPSLAVWKDDRGVIAHALRVHCQAMWDFANDALSLEEERIRVAKNCSVALRECSAHKKIMDQLKQLAIEMKDKSKSVPRV